MPGDWPKVWQGMVIGGVCLVLAMAGCASPTPYAPARPDGPGFSDQRIEEDRYRVTFSGNSATSKQTVENYLLYRAAELTKQTGNTWFRVVGRDTATASGNSGVSVSPGVGIGSGGGSGFFGVLSYAVSPPSTSYQASAIISVHKGDRPADDDRAYDAAEVIKSLGPTIVHPEE